ncbi:MAG: leucine-rich repeat protein, partial [archaeon]|nr:leucine-rich repeat protein [archaeon]
NLTSDSICVSVITSHLMRPVYSDLTESTGGALLNIYGDFGVEIGSLIWVIGAVIVDGNAVGLDLVSEPWRTEYYAGEYFNGTGLVVDAVFDNGERTLEHCSVTPSRPLTASDRNVTVHYRGMTLDIPIVVREDAISVTGVSVEGQGILMKVGEKVVLSADILPDDASFTDVVWVSSDVSCADVSDGVLTARSAGSAVVTVSTLDGGHYATCPVSVYGYGDTDGLSFDVDGLVMHTGMVRTLTLNPSSFYAVWDTSDPSVCTVEDGKVVAKHPGMAVVTATVDGYVATCNVLVEATATFMTKGFVYAVQHYVQGSVIDPPVPDTDRFVGWNGYTEGMTIYEDKVFDAVFDGDVCVIVFATGTHDIVRVVEPGDTIVAPSVIPVKENEGGKYYTFLRWDGYTEGMVADRDRVFDAVYDCSVYHTVTVNYNDGTVGKYLVPHGQRLENVPDVYMYFSNSEYTKVWSPQNSITKDLSLYATIEVSGHSGPMISWVFRFDTHVFTISGKGAMLDYEYNSQRPWHEYRSYIRDVVVNEGVTSIGSRSFSDCANLNNVTLPDSLVSLGKYAFYEDLNLDSINFGTSLRSVKYQALQGISFQYPNGTRVPILPEKLAGSVYKGKDGQLSLYYIEGDWGTIHWVYDRYDESLAITGKGAIPDCVDPTDIPWYNEKELIKTVTIGEGITTIGELAFRRFTSLEKVELPSTLKSIRMHAFQYVSTLKGIEFGTALNNVGWEAFESLSFKLLDGTSLKADANILSGSRFTGSDGVMYMVSTQGTSGDLKWYLNADVLRFEGTGSMADYKGPSSTPWYTYRLFIRTLVIDEGVTHIGDYAFQKYRALANVYLPDSLQSIGYHSFYSDVKIKHIEFGTGLKSLGTYAFYGNTFKDGSKTLTNSSASLRGHVFEGGKGVLVLKS